MGPIVSVDRSNLEMREIPRCAVFLGPSQVEGARPLKPLGCAVGATAQGLMDLLAQNASEADPGLHEGPGFPWAFDFVSVLLGGGGRI